MSKSSWPEVVGILVDQAMDQIETDRPDVAAVPFSLGTPLPGGYEAGRVAVFYLEDNVEDDFIVAVMPVIG